MGVGHSPRGQNQGQKTPPLAFFWGARTTQQKGRGVKNFYGFPPGPNNKIRGMLLELVFFFWWVFLFFFGWFPPGHKKTTQSAPTPHRWEGWHFFLGGFRTRGRGEKKTGQNTQKTGLGNSFFCQTHKLVMLIEGNWVGLGCGGGVVGKRSMGGFFWVKG